MAACSVLLAVGAVLLDRRLPESWQFKIWSYGGGPEGARAVLSVIASSMITVAGVVFSITIVALTLASSQFGPRLLRNFMRDSANQIVLGTFISTYLYCLLVLRTIRGLDENEFVPHIAVTAGVLLGVASLGVLIYFIHHVAISIQASFIVSTVGEDLCSVIERLFPTELGKEKEDLQNESDVRTTDSASQSIALHASALHNGYIQAIDEEGLLAFAKEHDLVVSILRRPGAFVISGDEVASFTSSVRDNDGVPQHVGEMFIIGRERNSTQDVEFVVSQLVEVALRALSPGINDPFTAVSCIDWLAVGLSLMAGRMLPSKQRYDAEGNLRVIAAPVTFEVLADLAFNQIRLAGQTHPVIGIRLLEAVAAIALRAHRMSDIQSLRSHAQLIWQSYWSDSLQGSDRLALQLVYQNAQRRLE